MSYDFYSFFSFFYTGQTAVKLSGAQVANQAQYTAPN